MDEQLKELGRRIKEYSRPWWEVDLTERELKLIANCRTYAANDPAGLPGHNLMLIIAKLADKLDSGEKVCT